MTTIKYSPYIPDVDAWLDYFKNPAKEYKKFYTIGRPKQKSAELETIKLVTPTQQVVEQAKSRMKREREEEEDEYEWAESKKAKKRVITKSTARRPRKNK